MTRDILNSLGEVIGTLSLPDGTSEEKWIEKLAVYAAPIVVPLEPITPRQIRLALLMSGITLEQIDASLGSLPEPTRSFALVEWEYATFFERTNPLVDEVRAMLGWTSEQLDELWRSAKSI